MSKVKSGHLQYTTVEEQASYWFFHLRSQEVTPQDKTDYADWLAADDRHGAEMDALDRFWIQTEDLGQHRTIIEPGRKIIAKLKAQKICPNVVDFPRAGPSRVCPVLPPRRFRWRFAAAAAAIAMVGIALKSDWFHSNQPVSYYTQAGEQLTVTLADGTSISLNTRSTVEIDYSDRSRRVVLVRGQANFDVAKDAHRKFVVAAGNGTVTALGTQFDVYKGSDKTTVTLLDGTVEVATLRPPGLVDTAQDVLSIGDVARLKPGEQVSFYRDSTALSPVINADPKSVNAWREGILYFRDTPLIDAISEANRYSTLTLKLANPELNDLIVSGSFATGRSEEVAKAIASLYDLELKYLGKSVITLTRPVE